MTKKKGVRLRGEKKVYNADATREKKECVDRKLREDWKNGRELDIGLRRKAKRAML